MNAPLINTRRFVRLSSTLVLMAIMGCQIATSGDSCSLSSSYAAGAANSLSQNINYLTMTGAENNQMAVTVGSCGGTLNIPCASVTICVHGDTDSGHCQTVDDILLDTGSYGLRVFSSLVPTLVSGGLAPEKDPANSSNNVGECVSYLDGSADWGQVYTADVYLGTGTLSDITLNTGAKASNIPIQLINSSYAGNSGGCSNPDTSPASTGFNGVLGVGEFKEDCGTNCANGTEGIYFSCTSAGSCTDSEMPLTAQVQNPVANFATDNNGIAVQFPGIPSSGAVTAPGYIIFGINTETSSSTEINNHPGSDVVMYVGDSLGDIQTTFESSNLSSSFLDSGSNGLYFPDTSDLSECSGSLGSFFCPCSLTNFTATMMDASGLNANQVSFSIASASVAFDNNNPNMVFNNLGGDLSSFYGAFDWGLPFFLGHTVFVGFENTTETINGNSNSGSPYFAF